LSQLLLSPPALCPTGKIRRGGNTGAVTGH